MNTTSPPLSTRDKVANSLVRRRRREALFRASGALATCIGLAFLCVFFASLLKQSSSAFTQAFITLDVEFRADLLLSDGQLDAASADYDGVVRAALWEAFPDVTGRTERRALNRMVSVGAAYQVRDLLSERPDLIGSRLAMDVPASADLDMLLKGNIDRNLPAAQRPVSDQQLVWIDRLVDSGAIKTRFNRALFANGDSREPELAGIRGALAGSFFMLLITACLSVPIGIAAAIYLEEFAGQNRWTDIIEVNINNLAAVPSIIFGLLGLAVFIDWLAFPRSAPLVGGLVLSLLTLPVIIIASRAAIGAVPSSIREGALALGASKLQVVFHHVLPQAMPGILTGAIIGLSRALGETAPLLMIGMVAFIADIPSRITDPATALPVQIFLWADSPERAFAERTAAAIVVLLGFLLIMNLAAVLLRRRLERRV